MITTAIIAGAVAAVAAVGAIESTIRARLDRRRAERRLREIGR